jgi:iron complex outermembrane receptor protein
MKKTKQLLLKCMKLTLVQLIFVCVSVGVSYAHTAEAQEILDQRISLDVSDEKLKSVLTTIEKASSVKFSYSPQVIKANRKITFSTQNSTLSSVLDKILSPLDIQYTVMDNQILLKKVVPPSLGETPNRPNESLDLPTDNSKSLTTLAVEGRVVGEDNTPIIGANVVIKGTTKGVVTDENGNFSIDAKVGDVLVVSFVGYDKKEFTITDATAKIQIILIESASLVGEVTVVGSRGKPRTDVERPVPVDVLSAKELQVTGQTDLVQQVQFASPSFNAAKNGVNGIASYADPASLKGLSPDQMLVLIEGKRYHQFSAIQGNVTVGKGTVVTDMSAVPSLALERMEILRDGAAAQYGSDAIAGIINLVLKKSTGKGAAQVQYGATSKGDGGGVTVGLNYGFALGSKGYLNVTGNYQDVKGTDRADPYNPQPIPGGTYTGIYTNVPATDQAALLANKAWGDGTYGSFTIAPYGSNPIKSRQAFYNAGYELKNGWSFYSFGNYSNKDVDAGAFLRTALPTNVNSNVSIYPNGYSPRVPGKIIDYSGVIGFKRTIADGWNMDFSTGYGKNQLDQYAKNSTNASLGAASPKDFYIGQVGFGQSLTEANLSKSVKTSAVKSLNLALGAQYRVDFFELIAGDEAASSVGPLAATNNKTPGSQGRVGIAKEDERQRSRSNLGVYVDIESDITDRFLVATALRYENYSDFGSNISGKLATRFKITEGISIRGSLNRGFRAPLLQQIASAATTSTVQAGVISSTKQLPSDEPKLKQLGITDPKAETSLNYNLGITAKAGENFLFTLDAYQIDIKDRIIITENLNTSGIAALKALFPTVQQVTFFTNAISTKTQGLDLVMSYKKSINDNNRFTGSLAFTFNKTRINEAEVKAPSLLQAGTTKTVLLLDTVSRALIETSQPHEKVLLTLGYQFKKLNITFRSTYFGDVTTWEKPGSLPHRVQNFGGKNLFDLALSYAINKNFTISVGGNNITDVYPDRVFTHYASYANGQTPFTRNANQFGFNGSYYYGTITANF